MRVKNRALRRSLNDFKRHPWLHLVSVATIVMSLVILGTFFLCYRNLDALSKKTSPYVLGTVYLKDGVTQAEINALKEKFLSFPKVRAVTYKEKDSVLGELQEFLGGSGAEVAPAGELFPNIFELQVSPEADVTDTGALTKMIAQYPQVAEVDFSEDWLGQYQKMKGFLKGVGVILMLLVLTGCAFITANFMGIRHQARREEIDVVRLIGGSRRFVLGPFLWEGVIEGLIGGLGAMVALYVFKMFIATLFSTQWSFVLGVRDWLYLSPTQMALVVMAGIGVACVGSITVFLRFEEKSVR